MFALVASFAAVSRGADASAPAAPATPAASSDQNADEPEPQLEGVVVERHGGGYMTLTMQGPSLVLKFFDEKKKAVAPDVKYARVKFRFTNRRPQHRVLVLGPDGMSLTHGRPIRAPYVFKAYVILVKEGTADESENDDESDDSSSTNEDTSNDVSTERYEVDFP